MRNDSNCTLNVAWCISLSWADNNTYCRIESDLRDMQTLWDGESVPDHNTLVWYMQTIPEDWRVLIVSETVRRCIDGAGGATGPLGADSSAT